MSKHVVGICCVFQSKRTKRFSRCYTVSPEPGLSSASSMELGHPRARQRPIRVKSHECREASIVTAGWERLAHALRWGTSERGPFTELFSSPFPAPNAV